MIKYELYKNKNTEILENIINDDNYSESDKIVASIILAEREPSYGVEETFNEILCCSTNTKVC